LFSRYVDHHRPRRRPTKYVTGTANPNSIPNASIHTTRRSLDPRPIASVGPRATAWADCASLVPGRVVEGTVVAGTVVGATVVGGVVVAGTVVGGTVVGATVLAGTVVGGTVVGGTVVAGTVVGGTVVGGTVVGGGFCAADADPGVIGGSSPFCAETSFAAANV
jgi:hypothetical protein